MSEASVTLKYWRFGFSHEVEFAGLQEALEFARGEEEEFGISTESISQGGAVILKGDALTEAMWKNEEGL